MRFHLSIEFSLRDEEPIEEPEVVIDTSFASVEAAEQAIEHELSIRPVGFGTY